MRKLLTLIILGTAALTGCGDGDETVTVPWSDYAPGLQKRIDRTDDCAKLQVEFNQADANNDATMARTGHNNADLMTYIDARMQDLGCY